MLSERVASYAFDLVARIFRDHFAGIVRFGAFADLTVCVTDFCKVSKYQKISLQAIEMLRSLVPAMLACPDCPLSEPTAGTPAPSTEIPLVNDPMVKFWFPILFSYYDVIMNGEDLEVRRLCVLSFSRRPLPPSSAGADRAPFRKTPAVRSTRSSARSRPTAPLSGPTSGTLSAKRSSSRSLRRSGPVTWPKRSSGSARQW